MLGKLIILIIAVLLTLSLLQKLAIKLGLINRPLLAKKTKSHPGSRAFLFTKFNIAMLLLVLLYFVWGMTQVFR